MNLDVSCEVSGKSIYLRELSSEFVSDEYVGWMNDPEVTQYLESRYSSQSLETVRAFVLSMKESSSNIFLEFFLKGVINT